MNTSILEAPPYGYPKFRKPWIALMPVVAALHDMLGNAG